MDAIRFEVRRTDTPAWGPVEVADAFINERNLVDLARKVELPFATRDGRPHGAGSYVALPVEAVFLPTRRLLGEPEERWDDWEGRISVLGCGCGVVGCWPLQATITARENVVVWEDFRQPHRRRWRYDALGPFVFDRKQYEEQLHGGTRPPKS